MALEQPAAKRERVTPATTSPRDGQVTARLQHLLSPGALGQLTATARGVPDSLWRRLLIDPVEELLSRPGKAFRGRLTEIAYRLAGGQGRAPVALADMLEVVHAGSMIIDDIEDQSSERRGAPAVHRLYGVPIALNAGNWMYFAPYELLRTLGLDASAELYLHRRTSRVLLDCHYGQALDLGARPAAIPQSQIADVVTTVSVLKTGRLLALAAEAGAVVAGADKATTGAIASFGEALGVGLQMLDDLGNLSGRAPLAKRYEDLRAGRVTWPWAWAAAQLDEARWAQLLQQSERLTAEDQAPGPAATPRATAARWRPLAVGLRGLVGSHGRLAAHWHLRDALCRLRDFIGPHAMLDVLEQEIARLEASYG